MTVDTAAEPAKRRLRILMAAYAFGPSDEPEANAGWGFATAAAQQHEVWVICRLRFEQRIAAEIADDPILRENLHVVHVDLSPRVRRLYRRSVDLYWFYVLWQRLLGRTARRLHAQVGFDVAHHVTFANDWLPSGLRELRAVPLVWGPVGGASYIPYWRLRRWLGARGVGYEIARDLATRPLRTVWGGAIARQAALVVAQNEDVAHRFRRSSRVVVEPNVALDMTALPRREPSSRERSSPTAVFAGRLIPLKGAMIALAAIAHPGARDWTLDIYGDGKQRSRLEERSRELGVEHRVRFRGHRPRLEALSAMARGDVLLFPSMHDQAAWSVGEASAIGTPVVCLPLGGPPTLAERNGFVVSLRGDLVANVVAQMRRALDEGGQPHSRWSQDRLPVLLEAWYASIVDTRSPDLASGGPAR